MPTFCRHNRLIQNCPICSREQSIELRPVLSSSAPRTTQPRPPTPRGQRQRAGSSRATPGGVRVRRLARDADDGYRSPLVPGLKASGDAERLAAEVAFAARRLVILAEDPPGLYAEVADAGGDLEERSWLAFLIAYLAPLEGDDPFAAIRGVHRPWRSSEELFLEGVATGPRTAHDPRYGLRTVQAYRGWTERAGSQAAAFTGEPSWTPERRFERLFERLALPGLERGARFELLVTLGRLGVYELRAGTLALGGENDVTLAAKRMFGIGDTLLLERRAAALASAAAVPLDSLDLALFNWSRPSASTPGAGGAGAGGTAGGAGAGGTAGGAGEGGTAGPARERVTAGLGDRREPDPGFLASTRAALGL